MQEIVAMKHHAIRAVNVYSLLRFYLIHLHLYSDVKVDWELMKKEERNGNLAGVILQRRVSEVSGQNVTDDESSVRDTEHLGNAVTEDE